MQGRGVDLRRPTADLDFTCFNSMAGRDSPPTIAKFQKRRFAATQCPVFPKLRAHSQLLHLLWSFGISSPAPKASTKNTSINKRWALSASSNFTTSMSRSITEGWGFQARTYRRLPAHVVWRPVARKAWDILPRWDWRHLVTLFGSRRSQTLISRDAIFPRSRPKMNRRSTGLPGKLPSRRHVTIVLSFVC